MILLAAVVDVMVYAVTHVSSMAVRYSVNTLSSRRAFYVEVDLLCAAMH